MRIFLRVFAYSSRYPLLALGTLFCAVVGTAMVAVFPAVTQRVVDIVLKEHHPERLFPLVLAGLGAFFARDLLNALRIILNNHFEQRVIFDLRSDLYARIQKLPLPWFDNRATGDIMTRFPAGQLPPANKVTMRDQEEIDALLKGPLNGGKHLYTISYPP